MANTGLRPDEGRRLQYRDVTIVKDEDTQERILEIEVRGKRGVGYCKSMPGAVTPFERLRKRNDPPSPETLIFGNIKNMLDASAINVRKVRRKIKEVEKAAVS